MARRRYFYKAQLLDAIALLESSRADKARRVLQTTLDCLDGKKKVEESGEETQSCCDSALLAER